MPPARTVADAADAFLARATATTTRRSYGQTMNALTKTYDDRTLEALDGPGGAGHHRRRHHHNLAPRTNHQPSAGRHLTPAHCNPGPRPPARPRQRLRRSRQVTEKLYHADAHPRGSVQQGNTNPASTRTFVCGEPGSPPAGLTPVWKPSPPYFPPPRPMPDNDKGEGDG